MAFNLPTEEEARAILADQMEAQARRMHDIDYRTPGPLQQAAGAGDVELVRDLLAAGEDPNKLHGLLRIESCHRRNENRTSRVHVSSARSLSSG